MSGFKSFSQKTTKDEDTRQVQNIEHSQVNSDTETQPTPPDTGNDLPDNNDQPDPNNK
ncbi:hypothetical protein [Acinetobacter venetianus]|jgi:hypothetical protein|uniref:hypothetical protein n=1 Tax=Acinetobacter venetianus TaxID=52133 RepID=UPI000AFD839F|nr:hypothetical protein [Acinetobacter venetianus]